MTDIYYNNSFSDFAKIPKGGTNYNFTRTTLHCSDRDYNKWGTCGDAVAYFLDDSGAFTIIGVGTMWNYEYFQDVPWYYSRSTITSVVIEDGVTTIGDGAFYDCTSLTSITIPDGVTYIGASAFGDCSALTSISIPDGVTTIGYGAFHDCASLTSITIPDSVAYIGRDAFHNCSAMDSVYISDLAAYLNINFSFGGYYYKYTANPMYYADKLYLNNRRISGDIVIPEGVINIPAYAFDGCDGITSVTIPDSVTGVGKNAFYNCSRLETVYIDDLSKWCAVSFENSSANPLYYAENLYLNDELMTDLVIPDGIGSIGSYAFYNYDKISNVTIPDSVDTIGSDAFKGCTGLTGVYITDLSKWCGIIFGSEYSNPLCNGGVLNINNETVTEIVIPDDVASVSSYAFYGCNGLTSITIPDSVTSVGNSVFYYCPNLTEVYYNLPTVPANLLSQSNYSSNASNVAFVVLGNNVTSIDADAFTGCNELRKIFIPRSVTEIENGAFEDCTKLTTVEYGGSEDDWRQVYIGDSNDYLLNAQMKFNSLAENAALTDADLLTYTVNDNGTITITNCYENAVDIDIPSEIDGIPVTAINSSAFANRTKLVNVTIPSSVTSIGADAFNGCTRLTAITIPEGITSINNSTFYNCSSLKSIEIPSSVTSIVGYAFYGCSSLTDVYYAGTEEQWNDVSKGYSNEPLTNAAIHCSSAMPEPLPMTTAEVTKIDTETGYVFEVTPETAYENCFVYAAVYDENGVLIALSQVPLSTGGSTSIEVGRSENDSRAAVFVWADTLQPIVTKAEFSLI